MFKKNHDPPAWSTRKAVTPLYQFPIFSRPLPYLFSAPLQIINVRSLTPFFQHLLILFYCLINESSIFCLHFFFRMKISSIITWLLRWENNRQLLLRRSLKYVCSCDVMPSICNENVLFKKQLPSWANWNKSKK